MASAAVEKLIGIVIICCAVPAWIISIAIGSWMIRINKRDIWLDDFVEFYAGTESLVPGRIAQSWESFWFIDI